MNLTEAEMIELKNTTNESEWNAVCDKIKAARKGSYPPDWFNKVLLTGVISEIAAKWGKEPLTLTEE
jgi:hypothetical protein